MNTKAVAATSSAEITTTAIAQPGPTVTPAIQHDPAKSATVMVEWSGTALPMEYQVRISIDDAEGKTGSLKQGFSLEFQVYPGPHKLTIDTLQPLLGGVQTLEKISKALESAFACILASLGNTAWSWDTTCWGEDSKYRRSLDLINGPD